MEFQDIQRQIEEACNQTTNVSTRAIGEQTILNFKNTSNNLIPTRYILENTTIPIVQFHMIKTIQEVILRDYVIFPHKEVIQIIEYLFNFTISHLQNLERFIKNELLHTISAIIKRSWLDENQIIKKNCLSKIFQLIKSENSMKELAILFFSNFLEEFSSDKATKIGLPYNFHVQCRKLFEEMELKQIFETVIGVINQVISNSSWESDRSSLELLSACVITLEKIFNWNFSVLSSNLSSFNIRQGFDDDNQHVKTLFPDSWSDIFSRPDIIQILFKICNLTIDHQAITHVSRQCLIQLSGLSCGIFKTDNEKKAYVSQIIQGVIYLIEFFSGLSIYNENYGQMLYDISKMIRRIFYNYKLNIIGDLPEFYEFINGSKNITMICLNNMESEESDILYDSVDAFDELLYTWTSLITQSNEFMEKGISNNVINDFIQYLKQTCMDIFTRYIDFRLKLSELNLEEVDNGFTDEELYGDQMRFIAIIARFIPDMSLKKIKDIYNDRFANYKDLMERDNLDYNQNISLQYLHEHIYWLTLITGHILTDDAVSEHPLVDQSLMKYSLLKFQEGNSIDDIVDLSNIILTIFDYVSIGVNDKRVMNCSPLVTETFLWFIERWIPTYLFINKGDYKANFCCPILLNNYSVSEGNGTQVLEFIVQKLYSNICLWNSEESLIQQAVKVLNALSKSSVITEIMTKFNVFKEMTKFFLYKLYNLPPAVHSEVIRINSVIMSNQANEDDIKGYYNILGQALENHINSVLNRPDFSKVYQNPDVIEQVLNTLEMFEGLALSINERNCIYIFSFSSCYITSFIQLFNVYRNDNSVKLNIFRFFNSLIANTIPESLTRDQITALYQSLIEFFNVFHNCSQNKDSQSKTEQDEIHDIIMSALELVVNIISIGDNSTIDEISIDSGDVIYNAMSIIIPMITEKLLLQTDLCIKYIEVISDLIEFYPTKLSKYAETLLPSIIKSLEFGINSVIYDVAEVTFSALLNLSQYYISQKLQDINVTEFLEISLNRLLESTMKTLLFENIDQDLIGPASSSLLAMITARKNIYIELCQQVMLQQQQTNPQYSQRLEIAFNTLNSGIEEIFNEKEKEKEQSGNNQTKNYKFGYKDFDKFEKLFYSFLINVRGFLR
ncbi:armadillo-type protein, partial [Neocallimastix sp. 'constans']